MPQGLFEPAALLGPLRARSFYSDSVSAERSQPRGGGTGGSDDTVCPMDSIEALAGRGAQESQRHHRGVVLALLVLVITLSAVVRFADLAAFPQYVWDEKYYAHDAEALLHDGFAPSGSRPWLPGSARSYPHPELGVDTIAAGIVVFGNNAWGWRVPAALAGTLLIGLVYPLARRMSLSPEWSLAATVLAAGDTMLIVQSRLAMLDIFVALWSVACLYCALRAVQSGGSWRWILLCGLAGGAATASKWSGGLAVLAALVVIALYGHRREAARGHRSGVRLAPRAALIIGIALVVYLASYTPYFLSGHTLSQWLHLQRYMVSFNWKSRGTLGAGATSRPLTWPFDAGAIWYHWGEAARGVRAIIALGNPLLWWSAIVAFIALSARALSTRSPRLGLFPLLVVLLYAPWLATSRPSYIYYMTPVVPFLAVLLASGLERVVGGHSTICLRDALGFAGLALAVCGLFGAAGLGEGGTATLPGTLVRGAALAAAVVLGGVAVARAVRGPDRRLAVRSTMAWGWVGAISGMAFVWLPFLLGYPVAFQYYQRITWFGTWK